MGQGGKLLATTVDAQSLSWLSAAWCALDPGCAAPPVDTRDPFAQVRAADQMAESKRSAATVARNAVGAASSYPSSVLDADLGRSAARAPV
jgi:hypothetical protein